MCWLHPPPSRILAGHPFRSLTTHTQQYHCIEPFYIAVHSLPINFHLLARTIGTLDVEMCWVLFASFTLRLMATDHHILLSSPISSVWPTLESYSSILNKCQSQPWAVSFVFTTHMTRACVLILFNRDWHFLHYLCPIKSASHQESLHESSFVSSR